MAFLGKQVERGVAEPSSARWPDNADAEEPQSGSECAGPECAGSECADTTIEEALLRLSERLANEHKS